MLRPALLFALLATAAQAQDTGAPSEAPETTDSAEVPSEEVTVFAEQEILRKRGMVIQNLRALGYREGARKDGRTTFRPDVPYHPTVILDDDAWMSVRRTPVRIDPPGDRHNALRYLWCLPPFTISRACIQVGGQVISPRKLQHYKERVARSTRYEMGQWREAVIRHAMDLRINEEVPDMLTSIWEAGLPAGEEGPFLSSELERRQAILDFWSSRSCLPEGAQVRQVVADFISHVIQTSATPATVQEIEQSNQEQRCPNADSLSTVPPT